MPFTFNPLTGQFDITGSGDTSGLQAQIDSLDDRVTDLETEVADITKYTTTFIVGDWSGPTAGSYFITIPAATHGKTSPLIAVFELNAGNYDEVETSVLVAANNDVTISVNEVPDLRFAGKLIIS